MLFEMVLLVSVYKELYLLHLHHYSYQLMYQPCLCIACSRDLLFYPDHMFVYGKTYSPHSLGFIPFPIHQFQHSHLVNFHFVNTDQMEIDKVGIEKVESWQSTLMNHLVHPTWDKHNFIKKKKNIHGTLVSDENQLSMIYQNIGENGEWSWLRYKNHSCKEILWLECGQVTATTALCTTPQARHKLLPTLSSHLWRRECTFSINLLSDKKKRKVSLDVMEQLSIWFQGFPSLPPTRQRLTSVESGFNQPWWGSGH